jgi:hypothetical protein
MPTRRQYLASLAAGGLATIGTASADGYPSRPDHITSVTGDVDVIAEYQPSLITSVDARQSMVGTYGWKAESSEHDVESIDLVVSMGVPEPVRLDDDSVVSYELNRFELFSLNDFSDVEIPNGTGLAFGRGLSVSDRDGGGVQINNASAGAINSLDELPNVDVTALWQGPIADRPSASEAPDGARYEATDQNQLYRNDPNNGWVVTGHGTESDPVPEGHYGSVDTERGFRRDADYVELYFFDQ